MENRFAGERAVVLGGAGFLGSHLVEALLREGADVVVVDNLCTGLRENVPSGARLIVEDMVYWLDANRDGGRPRGVGYVINLASPASPPVYDRLWHETLRVNSIGVDRALNYAVRCGATFFQASTSEIYGEPHIVPTPEDDRGQVDPTIQRSVYDEAKRFAETLVYAYHRNAALDVRVVRISNTFGPRMRLDDGRVVTEFIKATLRGQPFLIFGDGTQTRSLCYVDDMVAGFLRLLLSTETRPVNLGGQDEMTIAQIADAVATACGAPVGLGLRVQAAPLPLGDPTRRKLDITRAREVLGWEPTTPIAEGLRRTVAWARCVGC